MWGNIMLYMGSANRLIFWILIPLILFAFIAFRILESNFHHDGRRAEIAQQHAMNLRVSNEFNCLILGGSNSVFSLSAEQISNESDLDCYNLSLMNEGFSDRAYFDFIRNMSIDREQIKVIIYSSFYPLSSEAFTRRLQNNKYELGINGYKFSIAGRSLASYLRGYFQETQRSYPNPTLSGDFNFDLYDGCVSEEINNEWNIISIDDDFQNWIGNNLLMVQSLFQDANIYFVLPSILRSNESENKFTSFSKRLRAEVVKQSVTYIEQSPFLSSDVLCDEPHHGNPIGRENRTAELLSLLQNTNN